jgi:predicted transcriptional regulator of viral defense system
VVCLLSALRFHGLTAQAPHAVWIALPTQDHIPAIEYPAIRVVRLGEKPFTAGIQEVTVSGVTVRVYSPAKTVADCFKFRSKIGVDVALEALRDCLRRRAATVNDLWHYAKVCRVTNVLRPCLESVASE